MKFNIKMLIGLFVGMAISLNVSAGDQHLVIVNEFFSDLNDKKWERIPSYIGIVEKQRVKKAFMQSYNKESNTHFIRDFRKRVLGKEMSSEDISDLDEDELFSLLVKSFNANTNSRGFDVVGGFESNDESIYVVVKLFKEDIDQFVLKAVELVKQENNDNYKISIYFFTKIMSAIRLLERSSAGV